MKGSEGSTPYCRCRVKYLGSEVPHASKDGLVGVQEPLRKLYPEHAIDLNSLGIDSWLTVWSNGLLLENMTGNGQRLARFFPIESLHYCAAVRPVMSGNGGSGSEMRFYPLDSPFARASIDNNNQPLFAAVLRRTTGIKVLECHAFICKRDQAANALVRCCFHAYADNRYAKGLEPNGNGASTPPTNNHHHQQQSSTGSLYHTLGGSSTTLAEANGGGGSPTSKLETGSNDDGSSLYNGGDENHKVWSRGRDELDGLYQEQGTLRSTKGSRPRQLIAPPPPPPPPPVQPLMVEEPARKKSGKKLKKLRSKSSPDDRQMHHFAQHLQMQPHPQAIYTNGHGHHTLGHPIRQPAPHGYMTHQMGPGSRSVAGTLARPAPVLLVPAATLPRKAHGHPPRGIRPIPAAAPIVPIYAPLPVVPAPPSAMYPGGYGTTGNRGRSRAAHHHDQMDSSTLGLQQSRRMAASHADLSVPPPPVDGMIMNHHHQQHHRTSDSPENESRFGTGIYRRKGHLNERAFSYSIRAEHRSRSHGSLASLGFAGVQQNGGGPPNGLPLKEDKKTLEIAQMVAGLSMGEEEGRNGHAHPKMNGYHPQPLPRPRPR